MHIRFIKLKCLSFSQEALGRFFYHLTRRNSDIKMNTPPRIEIEGSGILEMLIPVKVTPASGDAPEKSPKKSPVKVNSGLSRLRSTL